MGDCFMLGGPYAEMREVARLALQNANLWEMIETGNPAIKYRIKSTTLPFLNFETQVRKTGAKYYINFVPEGDFTITFFETVQFDTYNYLKGWMEEVYDFDTRKFKKGDHSRDFLIIFQTDQAINPLVSYWLGQFLRSNNKAFKLEKVKIKELASWDLSYEGTDPLIVTATFVADKVVEVPAETVDRILSGRFVPRSVGL
jgi:hypothetical protein